MFARRHRLALGAQHLEAADQPHPGFPRLDDFIDQAPLSRKLYPDMSRQDDPERLQLDEKTFRLMLNDDAMATEKLAEGIRNFSADLIRLQDFIKERMAD